MLILRRVLLVIVATFLGWRMMSFGISEYYLGRASAGDASAIDRALVWNRRHPDTLYRKSQTIGEEDPTGSSNLLWRSFAENPASSFPLLVLADKAKNAGDRDQADALIRIGAELMPANPTVQILVGNYWATLRNVGAAMTYWSQALVASRQASNKLFPTLLRLAEEPRTIGFFRSLAESPPSWWEGFFRYVTRQAQDLETVRTLYAFRRTTDGPPPTREERDHYTRRLKREGKITEAYLVWVNGLDEVEQAHLGIINNRSFEIEPTNTGFDWHLDRTDRVIVTTATTVGVEGKQALHLTFRRREKPYRHIYQPLFLDPGASYRVTGKVRVDNLDSRGGLKWVVVCQFPTPRVLGESGKFLGSSEWYEFSFRVQVPTDCMVQEIRLVSAGTYGFEHKMTGSIWFDAISMHKVLTPRIEVKSSPPNETSTAEPAGSTTD
ncbi:hypothetical protein [Candidatus Thiosymbion oneisti]|uniref:hypothetical protein n=1 Tax=Candidatus Thiosymbion oneisti TaxID=589554 RepID=UPI000AA2E8C0|nr:hypothetical protein [Candidatus Thiosymbion oneisti]